MLFLLAGTMAAQSPKLFLAQDDIEDHRRRVMNDEVLRGLHDRIIAQADGMLALPPQERKIKGRRLLGASRTVLKRVFYLGYAYRMSERAAYADRLREELLTAAAYADWNPKHFLDVAEMTAALGIGYNWLEDYLTEADKERLSTAIVDKGLFASYVGGWNWWLNAHHNWNQVCNAGMTLGALAVEDRFPTLADSVIERSLRTIQLAYGPYAPDGAYAEGAGYYEYGTSFHCMWLDAMEGRVDASRLEVPNHFLNSAKLILGTRGPAQIYNYGDNKAKESPQTGVFYIARRAGLPETLYYQWRLMDKIATGDYELHPDGGKYRLLPLALIWAAKTERPTEEPSMLSWTGGGENPISVHRTSYADTATYVGIKGGYPATNHGHMDIGSFVLDQGGYRWVMDPGGHEYHPLEDAGRDLWDKRPGGGRWDINRYHNRTHSTLMVNGGPQNVYPIAPVEALATETGRGARVVMDSTYTPALSHARRTLLLRPDGTVVVTDSLGAPADTAASVRWAVLTTDDLSIDENRAELRIDDRRMRVEVVSPPGITLHSYSSQPTDEVEHPLPGTVMLGFEHTLEPGSQETLIVTFEPLPPTE